MTNSSSFQVHKEICNALCKNKDPSQGLLVKNPPTNTGDMGSVPGSERSPGVGNGNLLQYSCLENPMDRGAWWDTVYGVTKSQI